MGHQRQVLDETARFSFGGIACTQHTPLTRLQSSRTGDLSRLFELRADSSHHSKRGYETQTAENVRDSGTLHSETLNIPVSGRERSCERRCYDVSVHHECIHRVEIFSPVGLAQDLVDTLLEIGIEGLEAILE